MYKAYIFDLDGTLLDTLESLANCYNRALSAHGYPTHEVDAYPVSYTHLTLPTICSV